jgi:hypothetical protein
MADKIKINAGHVAVTPEGEYDATKTYRKLAVVHAGNSSYISRAKDNTGNPVTDTDWWLELVNGDDAAAAALIANSAADKATTATASANAAATKATQMAATANAAASSANTATESVQTSLADLEAKKETLEPLVTEAGQAIKNAQDALALATEGFEPTLLTPAVMYVPELEEVPVGATVSVAPTIYPESANKSVVYAPRTFNADIDTEGNVTCTVAGKVRVNVYPTQNTQLARTVDITYRELVSREAEDGTARETEDGEEIEC